MRYYCESYPDSVNHVSPSILMLDTELQKEENGPPQTILDLGCGNGRNSLYLAHKYDVSNVVLIDFDPGMLDWAKQLFSIKNIPAKTIHTTIETLASDPREYTKKTGIPKFDVVIFSYVIQHIDPVYYPIILDFCRQVSS
jgi:cyclopropane fatty-acyl-phospholipid synthase-like methyltransferase